MYQKLNLVRLLNFIKVFDIIHKLTKPSTSDLI